MLKNEVLIKSSQKLKNKRSKYVQVIRVIRVRVRVRVIRVIWKKVEEYLRLFETYGGNRFSFFLMRRLKLVSFGGRMTLRMKLIAQKELIFLFQMPPIRILGDQ